MAWAMRGLRIAGRRLANLTRMEGRCRLRRDMTRAARVLRWRWRWIRLGLRGLWTAARMRLRCWGVQGSRFPVRRIRADGLSGPFAIAIDTTGGAWIANRTGSSLSRISSSGDADCRESVLWGRVERSDRACDGWAGECVGGELGQQQRFGVFELGQAAVECGWVWQRFVDESVPGGGGYVGECVGGELWDGAGGNGDGDADRWGGGAGGDSAGAGSAEQCSGSAALAAGPGSGCLCDHR